ncbi:Hsp70 family protein [Mycobacterium shimoidei]|uniref:Hsp70 family protein n=1 Tax=Mycobacterium shimoidei TaxID=29313 RepID=UPI000A03E535|nr:Hsp70 family protein [Mycobacterium shimoidei]MCV7261263.1 Hsp70 family protein [Mycobacterium shimoidei]
MVDGGRPLGFSRADAPPHSQSALGLSVGATNLAAVSADRAVRRRSVLTLYPGRMPEVGVPSENPNLTERGLVITEFVDRVGDPAGLVAADGSTHRAETLLADALRSLAYTATEGRSLPQAVAISYPAHWRYGSLDAVRNALNQVPEWSDGRVTLLPDSAAATAALRSNPGLPTRGVIAVCDFGGTGSSLTLVDAANGYQPIAPTVRHREFAGDRIDEALADHVVAELSSGGSFDTAGTSSTASLTRLRDACRRAKEELSTAATTTLSAPLPGYSGDVSLTRAELDEVIRAPLTGFVDVIQEALRHNGIRVSELAAVASVGGGAAIPLVTATLSQHLQVPVITTPRPMLSAATGAALAATGGVADDGATALSPAATALAPAATELAPTADATEMTDAAQVPTAEPPLAWSEANDEDSGIMPLLTGEYPAADARPAEVFEETAHTRPAAEAWYRRPLVLILGTVLVMLAIGSVIMLTLRHNSGTAPSTPAPSVSNPPAPGAPTPSDTTDTQAPESSSAPAPSSTESNTQPPPSTTTQPPTTTETPTTTTTTEAPTTTSQTTQTPTSSAQTSTGASEQPLFPIFPRNPNRPRIFPEPGVGGR